MEASHKSFKAKEKNSKEVIKKHNICN